MKRTKRNGGIQLSLFDDMREVTDNELICELANKPVVAEDWTGEYRLERLFNSLTPHRRRIAKAAVELYKRREIREDSRAQIRHSKDAYKEIQPYLCDLQNEEFWIICLNNASRVIDKVRISVGGITQTMADIRLIMRKLVEVNATCFIAVHNHPSGHVRPSVDDNRLTEKLKNAGNLFDIKLVDHLIIAQSKYYSYEDEGLL